jgi:putative transposase
MLIWVPPKYSVGQVMGYIKGKSAIYIVRVYAGRRAVLWGSSSGRAGIGYRRRDGTKSRCVAIFKNKKRKISVWIN